MNDEIKKNNRAKQKPLYKIDSDGHIERLDNSEELADKYMEGYRKGFLRASKVALEVAVKYLFPTESELDDE